MIIDKFENLEKYKTIPCINTILKFLKKVKVNKLPEGDTKILGENLYLKVLRFTPSKVIKNSYESHKKYIDLQIIFKGAEKILFAGEKHLKPINKYNKKKDFQLFSAKKDVSSIILNTKEFVVFFPGEAHNPGYDFKNSSNPILKLVFKIKSN